MDLLAGEEGRIRHENIFVESVAIEVGVLSRYFKA